MDTEKKPPRPRPETPAEFEALKRDYEDRGISVEQVAERHAISTRQLYVLAHRYGWRLRNPLRVDPFEVNQTLLRLLQRQSEILEETMNTNGTDESQTLQKLATTLDKLIDNRRATAPQPKGTRTSSKAMIEIRAKVAARLVELSGD